MTASQLFQKGEALQNRSEHAEAPHCRAEGTQLCFDLPPDCTTSNCESIRHVIRLKRKLHLKQTRFSSSSSANQASQV